jgi:hypothetical protein
LGDARHRERGRRNLEDRQRKAQSSERRRINRRDWDGPLSGQATNDAIVIVQSWFVLLVLVIGQRLVSMFRVVLMAVVVNCRVLASMAMVVQMLVHEPAQHARRQVPGEHQEGDTAISRDTNHAKIHGPKATSTLPRQQTRRQFGS